MKLSGMWLVVIAVALLACGRRAQSEAADEQGEQVTVVLHSVFNLAVWRLDGQGNPQFDPTVIIAYIKDHVAPGTWNDSTRIMPSAKNSALLVLQTPKVHEKIRRALARLRAFADDDQLPQRLVDARLSYQQVLLFAADPNSDWTRQFFETQFDDENQDVQKALGNYILQCVHCDHTELLKKWGVAVPHLNGATIAILNAEGKLVTQTDFDQFARDGKLDPVRLAQFLDTHRMPLPNARVELTSAYAEAMRDDKRVLVQVSGPHCGPCILLARYFEGQKALFAKDYVYVKLDIRMPEAAEVIGALRKPAIETVPWIAILSADGQALVTSDGNEGNVAYPRSEAGIAHFKHMFRSTSRRLTNAEIDGIVHALGN